MGVGVCGHRFPLPEMLHLFKVLFQCHLPHGVVSLSYVIIIYGPRMN
jgi:hypothetical protein